MTTNVQNVAAIYCRISQDRQGRGEGVGAQERWGRAYAEEHWPGLPVRVFTDNDVSAAKDDAERPGFDALRAAVRAGQVAQLWAVEQSRITRITRVWFEVAAELVDAGVTKLHTKRSGIVDLDEVVGDIMAVLDAHEVRKLIRRLKDKKESLAHEGRPHGDHGFGYRSVSAEDHERRKAWIRAKLDAKRRGMSDEDVKREYPRPPLAPLVDERGRKRIEVVEDEAAALREAAVHILDGWTLTAIAKDLNRKGFTCGRGGPWHAGAVRRTFERASLAGLRTHQGDEVGNATWRDIAILDEATWRAVNAKLSGQRSYTRADGGRTAIPTEHPKGRAGVAIRHLLTGLAYCGVCEAKLSGHRAVEDRAGRFGGVDASYRCVKSQGGRSCVAIYAEPLEAWVRDRLFDQLDKPDFLAGFAADDYVSRRDEITDALRGVNNRRVEVAARLKAGRLTFEQFDLLNDGLRDEERRLHTEMADLPPPPTGAIDLARVRHTWPRLTFDERRQALVECVGRILVHRAYKGRRRVTAADVAERLGVSRQTVNYAHTGKGNLSAATRERVLAVAGDMGYERIPSTKAVVNDERVTIEWRDSR